MRTRHALAPGFGIALGLAIVGSAMAASDGTLGNTSTGTLTASVTKGDQVLISKVDDISAGQWNPGDGAIALDEDVCVYTTTGNYQITATSSNTAGGNFRMSDGTTNFIVYTAQWRDNAGGFANLTQGSPLTTQTGDNTNQDCGGALATNATFRFQVSNANMSAAPQGAYTDTITLVIAPE